GGRFEGSPNRYADVADQHDVSHRQKEEDLFPATRKPRAPSTCEAMRGGTSGTTRPTSQRMRRARLTGASPGPETTGGSPTRDRFGGPPLESRLQPVRARQDRLKPGLQLY